MAEFTHFNKEGSAQMVDVSQKTVTSRIAVARGRVLMAPQTLAMIEQGNASKGDVLGVARLAGIMGAKKTSGLIPLCHPLAISNVTVDLSSMGDGIEIEATVKTTGQTGVEMEALMAVNVAALTVYDMVKAVDKTMRITDVRLVLKDGGKSGRFEAK